MAELSDEDRSALKRLRRAAEEREAIPQEERVPVEDPARYEFPIGIDDQGNLFPPRPPEERADEG